MVSRRLMIAGGVVVVAIAGIGLASMNGGQAQGKNQFTAAMVSDTNGVNDKGFNQSAWEGLQKWGKQNNLTKGKDGYNYFQPKSVADYDKQLTQAATAKDRKSVVEGNIET